MYPADEWLIVAAAFSFISFCLVYWLWTKGKVRGDLFFWGIVCPMLIFFGLLDAAQKYSRTSDQIIKLVNVFLDWAIRAIGLGPTQFFVSAFIIALGFGAHYFKKKNQKWYGNVEITVGGFTSLVVAGTLRQGNQDLSKWATLAGAAYVIARGLGNREDAMKDTSKSS